MGREAVKSKAARSCLMRNAAQHRQPKHKSNEYKIPATPPPLPLSSQPLCREHLHPTQTPRHVERMRQSPGPESSTGATRWWPEHQHSPEVLPDGLARKNAYAQLHPDPIVPLAIPKEHSRSFLCGCTAAAAASSSSSSSSRSGSNRPGGVVCTISRPGLRRPPSPDGDIAHVQPAKIRAESERGR